jgi:hypothetical protein
MISPAAHTVTQRPSSRGRCDMNIKLRDHERLWHTALAVILIAVSLLSIDLVNHYYPVTRKFNGLFAFGVTCAALAALFLQPFLMNRNPAKWTEKFKGKEPIGRIWIVLGVLLELGILADAVYGYTSTGKLGLEAVQKIIWMTGFLIWMLWFRRYQTNPPNQQ